MRIATISMHHVTKWSSIVDLWRLNGWDLWRISMDFLGDDEKIRVFNDGIVEIVRLGPVNLQWVFNRLKRWREEGFYGGLVKVEWLRLVGLQRGETVVDLWRSSDWDLWIKEMKGRSWCGCDGIGGKLTGGLTGF